MSGAGKGAGKGAGPTSWWGVAVIGLLGALWLTMGPHGCAQVLNQIGGR